MRASLILLFLVLVCLPAPAEARQSYGPEIEISALIGARLGGTFRNGGVAGSDSVSLGDLNIKNSASYTGVFGWNFSENGQLELSYSHQPTEAEVDYSGSAQDSTLFDMSVGTAMVSALYRSGRFYDRFRPWLGGGFGATRFRTEGGDSDIFFALGATAGAHYGIDTRWAFRFQARLIATFLGQSNWKLCDDGDNCWQGSSNTSLKQWDLAAGITLKL